MFPAMGSYMTYAAIKGSKVAPGLMTRKQMESVYKTITNS
jgi:3-dehydroquinate dehydratase